jgi:hypothetical protein
LGVAKKWWCGMDESDIQSFWNSHPCGDHIVGLAIRALPYDGLRQGSALAIPWPDATFVALVVWQLVYILDCGSGMPLVLAGTGPLHRVLTAVDRNLEFGDAARRCDEAGFTLAVGLAAVVAGYKAEIVSSGFREPW